MCKRTHLTVSDKMTWIVKMCQVALFPLLQPEVPIALFTVWNEKLMPVAINTHTCHANGKVT